jgi:dienelactone hydrolase
MIVPSAPEKKSLQRMRWSPRRWAGVVLVAAGLAVLIEVLLHHYDPTRVVYKRLKAANEYVYEKVHPRFLQTDPTRLITIKTLIDVAGRRQRLVGAIWGADGYPKSKLPDSVTADVPAPGFKIGGALVRIDRLTVGMEQRIRSILAHFHPARPNHRLVLYHHGYAGTYRDNRRVIDRLLKEGYAVIALNLMGYGENSGFLERPGTAPAHLHFHLDRIDRPMRYHFEPSVVALNYAERRYTYRSVDMIGFSAGGFTTAVVAALDQRIRRSYPIAGVYPVYLREGQDILTHGPQYYRPMLDAAGYLDMFVLAVDRRDRRQMQVFNRYDRCCFNNVKGRLYEAAVQNAATAINGGKFEILIDETHADHKISDFVLDRLIADLARP